jgi:hypothetical protein
MAAGRVTFFTDENISHRVAKLLEAFDARIEVRFFDGEFDKGKPDVEWLRDIAQWQPKPVVLGGDGRILRNRAELRVLKECDMMFVYLAPGWTNLPWHDFAWKIIKAWPAIVDNVTRARQPSIFEVSASTLKVESRGTVASQRER